MNNQIGFFKGKNLLLSIALLVTGLFAVGFPIIIGLADDIPGIVLIIIGVVLLALAFLHHLWQTKLFIFVLLASCLGFVVFVILHNLFEGLSKNFEDTAILKDVLGGISAITFVMAILLCPLGAFIGLVGTIVTYFKKLL